MCAGLGLEDDSRLVRVYLPQEPDIVSKLAEAPTTEEDGAKLRLVTQAMVGVHLAAAAEAMSLGVEVGLEPKQLYEICAGAAGSSVMFREREEKLEKKTLEKVIADLVCFTPGWIMAIADPKCRLKLLRRRTDSNIRCILQAQHCRCFS